jgi:hypothetical protein
LSEIVRLDSKERLCRSSLRGIGIESEEFDTTRKAGKVSSEDRATRASEAESDGRVDIKTGR